MKINKLKILFIIAEGIVYYLIVILNISIPCFIKSLTNIPCPACGLTRSFLSILNLDFEKALYYNILGIPLFISIILINIIILKDIITKKDNLSFYYLKVTNKCPVIILVLIISELINIYHRI